MFHVSATSLDRFIYKYVLLNISAVISLIVTFS